MKLEKIAIYNCRSIKETSLPIDKTLTALVGANEHGKTNLLWAASLLNFKTAIKASDRRVDKNPIGSGTQPPSYVQFQIGLSPEEQAELEATVNGVPEVPTEAPVENTEPPSKEEGAATEAQADAAVTVPAKTPPPAAVYKAPERLSLKVEYKDGKSNLYSVLGITDVKVHKQVFTFLSTKLQSKIFFFDTFEDRLKHRIQKEEVVGKKDPITNGLLKLAGLEGHEELIFEDSATARQFLIRGGERLTEELKKLWVQGKEDEIRALLTVSKDDSGTYLNVDIEDFNTYGDVSTRSRGFMFFLAFTLKYKEFHSGDQKDFIFLIDEPGIFLHPRGQKDLLLYLENLSEYNQVIYTTHSPFTLNRLYNFRVRVISKDKKNGTKVDVKPYLHNWKSLRANLGMMLADSFYYADNNLIAEGSSDRLFLITLLKLFHENGIIRSDLNILSIIDSGGCPNVPSMARIVSSEERPFVVLVDSDAAGTAAKKQLLKFVPKENIKQVAEFKTDAVTIEDVLPRKHLNAAINAYIGELVTDGVIAKKPEKVFAAVRDNGVLEALDEYLKEHELGVDSISKLGIARHFEDQVTTFVAEDFKAAEPLVKWVSEALKLGV